MRRVSCMAICLAGLGTVACLPGWAAEPKQLPIGEVLSRPLTGRGADELVRIRGVVTWSCPGHETFTIEDVSGGIWVNCFYDEAVIARWQLIQAKVGVGAEVVVTGQIDAGGYAPHLRVATIDPLAKQAMLPLRQADLGRLFSGVDNARRVEITGIIQQCGSKPTQGFWSITLHCQARTMLVRLPEKCWPERPGDLIDAEVQIVGVTGAERNTRGEFLGPSLTVARPADIHVITSPPTNPFTGPRLPLDALGTFHPEPRMGHRIRTSGVVTLSSPAGFFVLQQGLRGVRVAVADGELPAVGEQVEVAGFLDMSRKVAGLSEAVVRRLGRLPLPPPARVTPKEIMAINSAAIYYGRMATPTSYEGCLVRFPATVVELTDAEGNATDIVLSSNGVLLAARFEGTPAAVHDVPQPGTQIDVTGVMQVELATGQSPQSPVLDPAVRGMMLLLRSLDDVVVVRQPPWWTPGHFGLSGMRERIERLGGACSIESSPGQATTVRACVQKRDYDAVIDVTEPATAHSVG